VIVTAKVLLFAALCGIVYYVLTTSAADPREPGFTPDKIVGSVIVLIVGNFLIFTWRKKQ